MTADSRKIETSARRIHDAHGARGAVLIAERIGAVSTAEDRTQFDTWMAIASQFVRLQGDAQAQRETARHLRRLLDTIL